MAVVTGLIIFLFFNVIPVYVSAENKTLNWPEEYYAKCIEIDFMLKYSRPFEMWYTYTEPKLYSRTDYNGGILKVFTSNYESYFLRRKIHPTTTKDLETKTACTYYGEPVPSSIQSIALLMPLYDYSYAGQDLLNNIKVDVWKRELYIPYQKKEEITAYVSEDNSGMVVPVRIIYKMYNLRGRSALQIHSIYEFHYLKYNITESDVKHNMTKCGLARDYSPVASLNMNVDSNSSTELHENNDGTIKYDNEKKIFEQGLRQLLQEANTQNLGDELTNQFDEGKAQRDLNETKSIYLSPFPYSPEEIEQLAKELPENFDLRMEGFITPVKHSGSECYSSWAFATVAAVEGVIARNNSGKLVGLSVQSLIDCSWGFGNKGCYNGTAEGALEYVSKYGIPTEMDYGFYKAHEDECNMLNMTSTYKISGFASVTPRNVNALKLALFKHGPVTAHIHMDVFMLKYTNGIFYDFNSNGKAPNYFVTVVGYGVRDGDEYWIVKNSIGEDWGEGGYILMSATNNNSYLLDNLYYPII